MNRPLKILLLVSFCAYLAFILGTSFIIRGERYFTLVDDAMISMRYARHFAAGQGLVWNIGEPPVQGFTNLGWTLVMGVFHSLPLPESKIALPIMLTSAGILLANIAVVYRLAGTAFPEAAHAPLLSALVTAFYYPLVFWSLRGMEVGALVLLLNLALLLALRDGKPAVLALVLSAAVLIRIDAAPAAALIALYSLIRNRAIRSSLPLIGVGLTLLAVFLFQRTYFGDWLPTTYYQKVAGYGPAERAERGILVLVEFASRDFLAVLLVAAAGLTHYRRWNRETILLMGIFLVQCAYSVYVGGDYAEPETNAANRFIVQGMPALFLLFGFGAGRMIADLEAAQPRKGSGPWIPPAVAAAVMTLLIVSGEPWFDHAVDNAPLLKADIRRVRTGLHIAENTAADAVIAVHAAGQIPYFSRRATIDLLGLNDPAVARGPAMGSFYPGHNKWNYEYSIGELQPDLIADNFAPLGEYIRGNDQYTKLESDLYVRRDSPRVDAEGLAREFR